WTPDELHSAVHDAAKEQDQPGGAAFKALYKALLGAERGPRAGHFLASLEREFVVQRCAEASKA
ncbi:MAG TPA: lysine--tRNA ligase, partial [Candidatus Thermoplasmatota archaeon]|nr:lysine--tRNA ligase [Candidatus Thermoplasmatota archaeon]